MVLRFANIPTQGASAELSCAYEATTAPTDDGHLVASDLLSRWVIHRRADHVWQGGEE